MIIIGELINASRKVIRQAIETRDRDVIQRVARDQDEAGADYIDVNAGVFVDNEAELLCWLVKTVQQVTDKPCAIDSPAPGAVEAALSVHRGTPMINSISLEKGRYEAMLPLVAATDCKVIALCMSDNGMPRTVAERMAIADQLVNQLTAAGLSLDAIHVDPLVQPLSVNDRFGVEFLDAVGRIMAAFPGIHTACGLSNISYGLPERAFLNQTFMTMAIACGLDGAIINPLDRKMMANIKTAEALAGRDAFCMHYLRAYRAGMLADKHESNV